MVHFGMCTRPDDVSPKQNPKKSTNIIPKIRKLTKLSESKDVHLRKKSRLNQPKNSKQKQNKSGLAHLGNSFLPARTTLHNKRDVNKKTVVSRMKNQNKYSLKVKRFYLIDSKHGKRISHQQTTETCTSTNPKIPEFSTPEYSSQSSTTKNPSECSEEPEAHPTIDLTTPECTYPESTTKTCTTSIPPVPECSDLPSTTQSHTTQDISTSECSDETETHPTIDLTTPECTYPESTTKRITTSIPTVPKYTDLPTTTQSHPTQDINTSECSDETETHPTIDLTTPEYIYPESTIKISRIHPTVDIQQYKVPINPLLWKISTIFSSIVPECSNEISTNKEHVVPCPITPECAKSEPPMTEKELGVNCPHTTILPDNISNPSTPKCSNQKSTPERHTTLHFLSQDCNSPHTTTESKPTVPECTNLEPTTTGCNNQQRPTLNKTKLKHTSSLTEVLSSNSAKPELYSEKSTILRPIKTNKAESKKQRPLTNKFENRLNLSQPRYFERQKSRFELTQLKNRQRIRMNKLSESDVNCNLNCTNDLQPVCGSNLQTYKNLCCFRKEKCLSKKSIWLVRNDKCKDFHSYQLRRNLKSRKFRLNQHNSRKMAQLSKSRRSRFWFRKSKSEIKSFVKTHHEMNNGFHAVEKHKSRLFKSMGQGIHGIKC